MKSFTSIVMNFGPVSARRAPRVLTMTCALGLLLAGVHSVPAEDWPQFRGPLGNGVANDTLPEKLDTSSVAWKASLPGRGLSSPIVVGDRIFVTSSSGPKQDRLHVICFNAADGSKRWERQFWATGRTMCHDKTSVAAPSPASNGRHIFAIFSSNDLLCLDLDGNLVWLRGLTQDYPNASNSLGMSSSLTVADGVLIAMVENDSESFTAGIDVKTGINLWKLDRPKMANWTSPYTVKGPDGVTLAVLQSGKGLAAVEPKSGRVLWQYTDGASTIPSGTVSDGVLYIPSKGVTALKPGPDGQSPKQLWRSGQLQPATSSPIIVGEKIFTLNNAGVLTCGNTTDGTRLWQLRLKGPFSATPVAAGTRLYCVNEKGILQVVETSGAEGVIGSELDLANTVLSTPAIAHGALYVRSDSTLWKMKKS
jgi:outer membrane protein assembly factor BamB